MSLVNTEEELLEQINNLANETQTNPEMLQWTMQSLGTHVFKIMWATLSSYDFAFKSQFAIFNGM